MQKNYFRWSRLSCLHMVQTVKRNRVDVVFAFFYNGTLIARTVLNETGIQKRQKNTAQCRHFVVAVNIMAMDEIAITNRYRWWSAEIVKNFKRMGIFLAQIVLADLFLADIASMPHNLILSRYETWRGDFNFILYMSIHNRGGNYLTMPMWSINQ